VHTPDSVTDQSTNTALLRHISHLAYAVSIFICTHDSQSTYSSSSPFWQATDCSKMMYSKTLHPDLPLSGCVTSVSRLHCQQI